MSYTTQTRILQSILIVMIAWPFIATSAMLGAMFILGDPSCAAK